MKKAKVLRMGYFPIPSLTERIVDNIFESLQEGEIVVEGGYKELKAEVLNMVREEVLENAEYASADKATIKAACLIARLKAERAWRQFRIDVRQLKQANS